jgi:spore maturation protein CgeB
MRFVLFYHSLVSDWNHPSAHFLRGVTAELQAQGHAVRIFEPLNGWSLHNLREQGGDGVVKAFHAIYPNLRSTFYDPATLDLDAALADADVVLAHEWNEPALLRRLGEHRAATNSYKLLFHDAPHRPLKQPLELRAHGLSHYDGVLASSDGLRQMYERNSWAAQVWTWHEAVDTRIFRPWPPDPLQSLDLIWIGAWGSGERDNDLNEYLIDPIRSLGLRARFYGAGFPDAFMRTLRAARIDFAGWIPDFCIPAAFSLARFTVHVPRRLQADGLPHTPAIRVLEALACGVPVVTAPWEQVHELFTPGSDLLVARDRREMEQHLIALHADPAYARFMAANGCQTVVTRHTCAHRVQELLGICEQLGVNATDAPVEALPAIPDYANRPVRQERSHVPAAWN